MGLIGTMMVGGGGQDQSPPLKGQDWSDGSHFWGERTPITGVLVGVRYVQHHCPDEIE